MILKRIKVNVEEKHITNVYIIKDEKSKEIMVIDPGAEPDKIIDMINVLNGTVKYILLTHCHADHIGAVEKVKEVCGGTILIHRDDYDGLTNPNISLTTVVGPKDIVVNADARVDDLDKLHLGNLEFIVFHTPGHTKGSICLFNEKEKLLISGDTLFRGTWGRTDCPTGDSESIMHSIMNKLLILPENTIVYPGHGKMTLIKEEEPIYFGLRPRKET